VFVLSEMNQTKTELSAIHANPMRFRQVVQSVILVPTTLSLTEILQIVFHAPQGSSLMDLNASRVRLALSQILTMLVMLSARLALSDSIPLVELHVNLAVLGSNPTPRTLRAYPVQMALFLQEMVHYVVRVFQEVSPMISKASAGPVRLAMSHKQRRFAPLVLLVFNQIMLPMEPLASNVLSVKFRRGVPCALHVEQDLNRMLPIPLALHVL